MSNPGEASGDGAGDARPSGDSPKPHGDTLAGAARTAATTDRRPGDARPSGDSPKPHGDKLAGAAPGAAAPEGDGPGRGRAPVRGG